MTTRSRFPLLVLSDTARQRSTPFRRFASDVRASGGVVTPRGALVRDIHEQVRSLSTGTHVLFLGSEDTPVSDFVSNIDDVIFEEFTHDVVYANKSFKVSTRGRADDRRLPMWSPHRIEHENFIGESFLVRVSFLLSLLPHGDMNAEWDPWAFLLTAKAHDGRFLKVDQTWFAVSTESSGVRVGPTGVRNVVASGEPAFSPADCSLITLSAGSADSTRAFPTLIEEHLDAIARSTAAAAEHLLVLGPECPESLRSTLESQTPQPTQPSTRLKIVDVEGAFNFAYRCNVARTMSSGAITVLINDDFVPMRADWLDQLIAPFSDPDVGITGATMLYADDTIQHIGVGVRDGNFQHFYAGAALTQPRIAQLITMNREVDAVTGACLAIRAELYDEVGGLTDGFPLNYNDIDLCLKVRALGLSVILVGAPLGYHLESRTRPAVALPEEMLLFYARWPFRSLESDFPFENLA